MCCCTAAPLATVLATTKTMYYGHNQKEKGDCAIGVKALWLSMLSKL
jgi:hypothetical protein